MATTAYSSLRASAQEAGPITGADRPRLTRKETALLRVLQEHAGSCLPRELLLRTVWGYQEGVKSRTVDVHIQRLRKKLKPADAARILTVFRGGYVWTSHPGAAQF